MKKILIAPLLVVLVYSTGCVSRSKQGKAAESKPAEKSAEAGPHEALAQATTAHEVAVSGAAPMIQTTTTVSVKKLDGVDPEVALRWLKNGNKRFVKGWLRNDGQSKADVERLSTGQKPHSIILACSDSRVPPEIVFDQKLGEVFVVRTAGEVLDPGSIASIEYAVEHLGTRNIVVMGHSNCGAVKAAMSTFDGKDAGSENLNKLVDDIHPRISTFKGQLPSKDYVDEGWANVSGVVADLQKRSKILSGRVSDGDIQITGSLYHLDNGTVEFK
jgi:carbonic anhydrase